MSRTSGGMSSLLVIAVTCSALAAVSAGPLPSNVTSSDTSLKPGSCALGDVVYMVGDEFPGSDPCERCACVDSAVRCARQHCDPRPGCKAVHRPDHCCPTYQCECEQEGRVYDNGEKLVDPQDPCRVCYCQGGEVVCRRIACFVRDDCRPRLVPGRCCPDYDNCPLRGVTTVQGMAASMSSVPAVDEAAVAAAAAAGEHVKHEITIKEITPVSEIPALTHVKIKEVLPSHSFDVVKYPSSKSPLIPREATTERSSSSDAPAESEPAAGTERGASLSSDRLLTTSAPEDTIASVKGAEEKFPSKISLSTAISSDIKVLGIVSTTSPVHSSPKTTPVEEEDSTPDLNPAFPPIPDDLSQQSNHEDEIPSDPNMDNDHNEHLVPGVASSTELSTSKEHPNATTATTTTSPPPSFTSTTREPTTNFVTSNLKSELPSSRAESTITAETPALNADTMLNLRSAIPSEILSVPSSVPEVITGELDEDETSTYSAQEFTSVEVESTTKLPVKTVPIVSSQNTSSASPPVAKIAIEETVTETSPKPTPNFIPESITDVTSRPELSSSPADTSERNRLTLSDKIEMERFETTSEPSTAPTSIKIVPTEAEPITISRSTSTEKQTSTENFETTEFFLTSSDSSETATEPVELIKMNNTPEKSAAIIEPSKDKKNNILNDLIDLVGDVALMSNHTDEPETAKHLSSAASIIPDSEELIPVNSGYKSKNYNINQNSITELPPKSKYPTPPNKSKIVEIEDDEGSITDSPAPNDKSEPTTRRPIIDNVSDGVQGNESSKSDIEIITKSYVPTINRKPTKVIMKKSSDRADVGQEASTASAADEVTVTRVPPPTATSSTAADVTTRDH